MNHRAPLVLAACLFGSACGDAGADNAGPAIPSTATVPNARGTRVETALLAPADAQLKLRLPGEVAGSRDVTLASAAGGYVESVRVRRGETVGSGQTIATINTGIYAAQRDQARAQVDLAASEYERVKKMGDLASESQHDNARTQLAMAEASRRVAELNVSRSVIRSPFAGTVVQTDLDVGEVIGPGAPAARLVQLDPIFVTVAVADRDVGVLREGMGVSVNVDAVPGVREGVIRRIDKAADTKTRAFEVEVELPNPAQELLPGMIASVSLSAAVPPGSIILPQDWLVTQMNGIGVYVVEDNVARWRPVEVGTLVHDQIVIRGGLETGETIVITGHRGLNDGDPLIISRQGKCCTNGKATF